MLIYNSLDLGSDDPQTGQLEYTLNVILKQQGIIF